jgi:hypothetical protein
MKVKVTSLCFAGGYNSVYEVAWEDNLKEFIEYYDRFDIKISEDDIKEKDYIEKLGLFSDRVGIRILPNKRAKYIQGKDLYFGHLEIKHCQIDCAYGKNDAIVFIVSHAEAVKHGLVKED